MPPLSVSVLFEQVHKRFDAALYALSTYLVPVAIGALSILAFLAWPDQIPQSSPDTLAFRVLQADERTEPREALAKVRDQKQLDFLDTRRSEAPFWFLLQVDSALDQSRIEFPSRHAVSMQCWDGKTLEPIGSATRTGTVGAFTQVKGAFRFRYQTPLPRRRFFVGQSSLAQRA